MKKNKIFKVLAMVMAFTMMFSVNVFAAEEKNTEFSMQRAYEGLSYSHTEPYEFEDTLWGQTHKMVVNVKYELDYSYADALWSQINYVDIEIVSVYIDEEPVASANIESVEYRVYSSSAYRIIEINDSVQIRAGINVDEYGGISIYAYML